MWSQTKSALLVKCLQQLGICTCRNLGQHHFPVSIAVLGAPLLGICPFEVLPEALPLEAPLVLVQPRLLGPGAALALMPAPAVCLLPAPPFRVVAQQLQEAQGYNYSSASGSARCHSQYCRADLTQPHTCTPDTWTTAPSCPLTGSHKMHFIFLSTEVSPATMGAMLPEPHKFSAATALSPPPPHGQMPVGVGPFLSATKVPLHDCRLFASLQPRHCDHLLSIIAQIGSPHCYSLMALQSSPLNDTAPTAVSASYSW